MTIRVRPADVEVPQDDPFKNDLLDRKPSIEALTDVLGSLEGPCVLALDSEWGGGKTTFLKMWAAHLRNEGFAVVEFNAWETDFSGDPFVALSARLQEQLDDAEADDARQSVERFRVAAKKIALRAAPIAIRLLSQGLLEPGSLEKAISEEASSYVEDRLEEFDKVEQSFVDFRDSLQEGAERLSEKHNNHPLFIMIDELDRCRPSYAIELLEVAKHLFSVDRIVFVLALNRRGLAHSVRALYGVGFEAEDYLHRFFDLDYTLPSPNREEFVVQTINDTGFSSYFPTGAEAFELVPSMIARMLAKSTLDLRSIAQAIRRLSLVCSSVEHSSIIVATAASGALILRTLDPEIYEKFCKGRCGDDEVVKRILGQEELGEIKSFTDGYIFEAIVCLMWCQLSKRVNGYARSIDESPLLSSYCDRLAEVRQQNHDAMMAGSTVHFSKDETEQNNRCGSVVHFARQMNDPAWEPACYEALDRLELLPT